MKRNVELSYFWKKRSSGRSFISLGILIPVLLITGLSFKSFFRPYHEHENADIPTDSIAFSYSLSFDEGKTFSEIQEYVASHPKQEWKRLEGKADDLDYVYVLKDPRFSSIASALIAEPGFQLSRLGSTENYPLKSMPNDGLFHVLYEGGLSQETRQDNSFHAFAVSSNIREDEHPYPASSSDLPFLPRSGAQVLYLTSRENIPETLSFKFASCYAVFHLSSPLPDQDLNCFISISKRSSGILPCSADWIMHPAVSYASSYPVYHEITSIVLLLCISISIASFLSSAGKEFIKTRKERNEVFALKTLGMRQSHFVLGSTSIKSLPLFLGFFGMTLLYLIGMGIFYAAAGFTFFFPWWGHLLYWAFPLAMTAYLSINSAWDYKTSHAAR